MEGLNLFERESSGEDKDIRVRDREYIQTFSMRKTTKILSEFHSVPYTAIWKWVKKFEKLPISTEE